LPEPLGPVTTVISPVRMSRSRFFRLCWRAPRMRIRAHPALSDHTGCVHALLSAGVDPALRTTRDSRWRLSGISRGFGPGLVVRRGATALDLARDQQASARFSTQTHVEVVKQLQAVTPRPGLLGRRAVRRRQARPARPAGQPRAAGLQRLTPRGRELRGRPCAPKRAALAKSPPAGPAHFVD
jgi:hypothetical protein